MTEIYWGPWDPLYGDVPPKDVYPSDPYHEPYPGAWDEKFDLAPIIRLEGSVEERPSQDKQPRGRERLLVPQVGCQW